jgi:hypothetical protein
MKRLDLHWLAGYLEGEGYFGFMCTSKTNKASGTPRIEVTTTDYDIAKKCNNLLNGGKITTRVATERRKKCYSCRIAGDKAIVLMDKLAPLMGKRRQEAIIYVLEKAKNRPKRAIGSKCYNAILKESDIPVIRALKAIGASVKDIAYQIGAPTTTINHVISGDSWRHINI